MKKLTLTTFLTFLASTCLFAQKTKDDVLLTINDEPVMVSEFRRVYEKNLDLVDEKAKDIDDNLDLFINYKLKVKEAYDLKLDTTKSYKKELQKYKQQLIAPYLRDKDFEEKQIQEAYNRTKEEVRASHILILFPKDKSKIDTVAMIAELNKAKARIKNGESFEKVAKEVSQDPSAKTNGGDLGYFSAFRMVYPFENAAYTTKVGEISEPFKTRFGYHILQVSDKRPSIGEFKVAHILVKESNANAEARIKEAYDKIEKGASFEDIAKEYSDDRGSNAKGGVLPKFGTGRMVPDFEKQVVALKNKDEVSKPFKTRFGWHIVKMLEHYPVPEFEKMEAQLTKKIKNSSLGALSQQKVISKLKEKYNVTQDKEVLDALIKGESVDEAKTLFTIEDKVVNAGDFDAFTKSRRNKPSEKIYNNYFDRQIIEYFKQDLEKNDTDFKYTFNEYKDGLLLFDLMQNKIWNKSSQDATGIQNYFDTNKSKYKADTLEEVKGKVINDYQKHLEESWINDLRSKNNVTIKKKALKKFKAYYKNKK